MAKSKKFREIDSPSVISITGFTAEQHEEHYKRDYEFNKPAPTRSPVGGWEYKYASSGQSTLGPKELSLVKGTPHTYKGMRTNNSYGKRMAVKRIKG